MNKITKADLKRVALNIKKDAEEDYKTIKNIVKELFAAANAKNVSQFMSVKKNLLHHCTLIMPLNEMVCPFCVKYLDRDKNCPECPYGKAHGVCIADDQMQKNKKRLPDYAKLMRARRNLQIEISNYWRDDERI